MEKGGQISPNGGSGDGVGTGTTDSANSCKYNDEIAEKIKKIIENLDIIRNAFDSNGKVASQSSLSELKDEVKKINDVVNSINTNLSTDNTLTMAYSETIDKNSEFISSVKESMTSITTANRNVKDSLKQINDKFEGLKELIKGVKDLTTDVQNKLEQFSSVGGSGRDHDISGIERRVKEEIKLLSEKIDKIISKVNVLPKEAGRVRETSVKFEMKTEHKTYLTWTAVFAIALILSAIFITRGYLVDFVNPAYLTSVLIIFCVSFFATSIFNLVFAIAGIDLSDEDVNVARLSYYIICGILDGVTLLFSIIVLAI